MSKLLYIQASPRGQRSKSIKVADAFVAEYAQSHPDDVVETLNVFEETIPSFDGMAVQAKYTIMHGKEHTQEELKAWKEVEKVIKQFKAADKYVLAAAMWNFSIPYRLKQYIDILVQPGYTFSYSEQSGYEGLVVDKPMLVVYARGGEYEGKGQALDLQKQYIELILGFIGFKNLQSIIVEPTLQGGPDVADLKIRVAITQAKALVSDF